MKKLTILLLVLISISALIAEGNTSLYGEFELDYDITEDMIKGNDPALGGFNMPKALLGAEVELSDNLIAYFEYKMRDNKLHLAYFDWRATESITLSGGRMMEAFAPNSEWYGETFEGIGVSTEVGIVNIALQTGNMIEDPDDNNTGEALTFMPALTVNTDVGAAALTVGLNGKYITAYDDTYGQADTDSHFHLNTYTDVEISDFSASFSVDFNELQGDLDSDMNLNVTYALKTVTPGVLVNMEDIIHETNDMQIHTEIYASFPVGPGLVIKPIASLSNITEANKQGIEYLYTLKFLWKPAFTF